MTRKDVMHEVKEVMETTDAKEVGTILKSYDWILLDIVPSQQIKYVLGRIGG